MSMWDRRTRLGACPNPHWHPICNIPDVTETSQDTPLDAFDQLAWDAAKDVLAFEEKMPGQQDPAVLGAAIRVLQILSGERRRTGGRFVPPVFPT